jgi:hypothetical protein
VPVLAGVVLLGSPSWAIAPPALRNAMIVGALIAGAGLLALYRPWVRWIVALLGLWLAVSQTALYASSTTTRDLASMMMGLFVGIVTLAAAVASPGVQRRPAT